MIRLNHGKPDPGPESPESILRQRLVETCLADMGFQSAVLEERSRGRKAKVCIVGIASDDCGKLLVNAILEKPLDAPMPNDEELPWAWHLFENKQAAVDFLNEACGNSRLEPDDKHMLFIAGGWMGWAFYLVSEDGIGKITDPTAGSGNLPWMVRHGKTHRN